MKSFWTGLKATSETMILPRRLALIILAFLFVPGCSKDFQISLRSEISETPQPSEVLAELLSVTTDPPSDLASTSVMLNATVKSTSPSLTGYFEYGLTPAFGSATALQTLGSSGDELLRATLSNLALSTTYYYRAVVQSSTKTSYGTTRSFVTTRDLTKPSGTITLNFNAEFTDSPKVMLNLSATADLGVTGYFVSESATVPKASQPGWITLSGLKNLQINPSFPVSGGNGSKRVYVWYKDASGNISDTASDSILLVRNDSWKNHYAISWRDTPSNSCKYAKQMGYEYVALRIYYTATQYRSFSECSGLKFYMADPQHWALNSLGFSPEIDTTKTYSQAERDWYNQNMSWKSTDPFPQNLATGWWQDSATFAVVWDLQQQAVIDVLIERELALFRSYRDAGIAIAGYFMDIAKLTGDFDYWDGTKNIPTDMTHWLGRDSTLLHSGITHEYATYSDGMAAYYKQLKSRVVQEFSDAKWIIEPWVLQYVTSPTSIYVTDEWVEKTKSRADRFELLPDMLAQESSGTEFVDNSLIFNSGLPITKDMVASSQQEQVDDVNNRKHAAKAGINGAWYNWFGHFGARSGFNSIVDVYPRLKLIRVIPNWDNLRNIPLTLRSWNNDSNNPIYQSYQNATKATPLSYFDQNIMYSRHWKNNKLFAVFNSNSTPIRIALNESIVSIKCVDDYFIETTDCSADFQVSSSATAKVITRISAAAFPTGADDQSKGVGYIITVN